MDEPRSIANKVATQHQLIDSQLRNLAASLDGGLLPEAEKRLQRLMRSLEAHFTLEEEHYFPSAEAERAEVVEAIRSFRADHVELRRSLEDLAQSIGEGAMGPARSAFARFSSLLLEHERRELDLLAD